MAKLNIPAGTQAGAEFRLRGKGVPVLRSNKRGDQVVTARVVVPEKLTEKQRKLLRELGESLGFESLGEGGRNIFEKFVDRIGEFFS
jgi:molecular chaperone DnaJ